MNGTVTSQSLLAKPERSVLTISSLPLLFLQNLPSVKNRAGGDT